MQKKNKYIYLGLNQISDFQVQKKSYYRVHRDEIIRLSERKTNHIFA